MTVDPVTVSEQLVARGAIAEAESLLTKAGHDGHTGAMFRLAAWRLIGQPIPRDLVRAREWLQRAADRDHVDAALLEIALIGNGTGAPADWTLARARLERAKAFSDAAADQHALLSRMSISAKGYPTATFDVQHIGKNPNVWRIRGLFTAEECLHVAQAASDLMAPAIVVDPRTGRNIANPIRTSYGAVVGPMRESLVIQALNRRLANVTGTDVRQGEALSVLRYTPGQEFRLHIDAIQGARNQRIKTAIVYLNSGFGGGATSFISNGLSITPQVGDAIVFDNVKPDGSIDPTSQHAGEPVTHGVKWIATRWIRARPFDVWQGPESV